MRQVSKKRAKTLRERKKLTASMKANGPVMCGFVMEFVQDGFDPDRPMFIRVTCDTRADDLHEIVSRARGGSITDPTNVLPLCREHHIWVTEHLVEAEAMGLSGRKK